MFMKRIIIFIVERVQNMVKDFLNVYLDEKHIREAYGDEYADRFSTINPVNGKRKISVAKVLQRIFIVFIIAFVLFLFIRIISTKSLWV